MNPMKHIRKNLFNLSQTDFAALAGVGQATVSRWESGGSPTLDEMKRIRAAAEERGLEWDDRFFFEAPETAA